MTPEAAAAAAARPRVEGDREQEILDAALEVLADVGYDRLTMDAVAQRAKASKATLYRRWNSKAKLVVEALARTKSVPLVPDTGDLRSDLLTAFCGMGGLTEHETTATLGAVMTAVSTDREFAREFRAQVVEPKASVSRADLRASPRPRGAPRRHRPRHRRPGPGRNRPAPGLHLRRAARCPSSSSGPSTRSSCRLSGRRAETRQVVKKSRRKERHVRPDRNRRRSRAGGRHLRAGSSTSAGHWCSSASPS